MQVEHIAHVCYILVYQQGSAYSVLILHTLSLHGGIWK